MKVTLLSLLQNHFPQYDKEKLYAYVLCGEILVNGQRIRDPKQKVEKESQLELRPLKRYASRGGVKLEAALKELDLDCKDKVILDCGASSGGFTSCLLAFEARLVYAVDVGYAQLAYNLRRDPRVRVMERTNLKSLKKEVLNPQPDFAVCDLSFRSLFGCAAHLISLTADKKLLALVKPQFEWQNPPSHFRGVVKDELKRQEIIYNLRQRLEKEGIEFLKVLPSVLPGRKGNVEYFFYLTFKDLI